MLAKVADYADKLFDKIERHLILFRILAAALAAIVASVSSVRMIRHPFAHGDFGVYLHAAHLMRSGENIYTSPTHPVASGGLFYLYPPLLAFLFIPLSYLPENWSIVLWTVLNIALIAWLVPASFEIVSGARFSDLAVKARWAIATFSLLLTGRFFLQHLDRGQTNILELALLVLGVKLIAQERRGALGGAIIGLSVALKVLTAPYTVWLALEKQAKALAGAGIGLAIGLLSPALLLGWRANLSLLSFWFHHFVLDTSQQEFTLGLGYNYSIRGVVLRLFAPVVAFEHGGHAYKLMIFQAPLGWIDAADWVLRFAVLGVVIAYWFRFRNSSALLVRGGGLAISCAAIPLLFPTAQQNYFVFLLPTAIYVMYWPIGLKMNDSQFLGWFAAYVLLAGMTTQAICGKFLSDLSVAVGCVPLGTVCLMFAVFRAAEVERGQTLVPEDPVTS